MFDGLPRCGTLAAMQRDALGKLSITTIRTACDDIDDAGTPPMRQLKCEPTLTATGAASHEHKRTARVQGCGSPNMGAWRRRYSSPRNAIGQKNPTSCVGEKMVTHFTLGLLHEATGERLRAYCAKRSILGQVS